MQMAESVEFLSSPWLFPQKEGILFFRQILVEELIQVPLNKPDIEQLADLKVKPIVESCKLIHSPVGKKLYVRGRLEQVILYVVDEFCQPVHALNVVSDFQTIIEPDEFEPAGGILLERTPEIIVEFAEAIRVCPRSIRKNVILFIWYPKSIVIPPAPPCPPPPVPPQPFPQPIKIINQTFCEPPDKKIHISRRRPKFRDEE